MRSRAPPLSLFTDCKMVMTSRVVPGTKWGGNGIYRAEPLAVKPDGRWDPAVILASSLRSVHVPRWPFILQLTPLNYCI